MHVRWVREIEIFEGGGEREREEGDPARGRCTLTASNIRHELIQARRTSDGLAVEMVFRFRRDWLRKRKVVSFVEIIFLVGFFWKELPVFPLFCSTNFLKLKSIFVASSAQG